MNPTLPDTLLVRRLPENLTEGDLNELFRYFGAQETRKERPKGKMRNSTVLVKFQCHEDASYALSRLHQLKVLDRRIVVEFADFTILPQCRPNVAKEQTANFDWIYPAANEATVRNIANALLKNSEFYNKVIQLMNNMNLPPPFGDHVQEVGHSTDIDEVEMEELYKEDTEESELEPDESLVHKEVVPELPVPRRKKRQLKKTGKLKLSVMPTIKTKTATSGARPICEVFEQSTVNVSRKLEVKISNEAAPSKAPGSVADELVEGFGTFAPVLVAEQNAKSPPDRGDNPVDMEFVSKQKLLANKLQDGEMELLPVFKNYSPGIPNTRLYVKNIAKTVKESDLKHIYGRYVDWNSDEERKMFDIRHMTEGRMKGQAFISLPSVDSAEMALRETNGFMLQGKPMVVHFARSASASKTSE